MYLVVAKQQHFTLSRKYELCSQRFCVQRKTDFGLFKIANGEISPTTRSLSLQNCFWHSF